MVLVFWICLVAIAYPYAIYPLLLVLVQPAGAGRRAHVRRCRLRSPSVTMILPVHNEARRIDAKMRNLLALDYPADKMQMLVIGDGCTDDTLARAQAAGGRASRSFTLRRARGKAAALNAGLERATRRDRGVHRRGHHARARARSRALVAHFADPAVGCVSGEDYVEGGGSEGLYGRIELLLRREEARLHSIAGASGCFYAQRRALCQPFVAGMAPDFLSVLQRGARRASARWPSPRRAAR